MKDFKKGSKSSFMEDMRGKNYKTKTGLKKGLEESVFEKILFDEIFTKSDLTNFGAYIPKIKRTKMPPNTGAFYSQNIMNIPRSGARLGTAVHELGHHLDFTYSHGSYKLLLDALEGAKAGTKSEWDTIFKSQQGKLPNAGYTEIWTTLSNLNTDGKVAGWLTSPWARYFQGLWEGYATDKTFEIYKTLLKTNPELAAKIGNPYGHGMGYYGNLPRYLKNSVADEGALTRLGPETLQGILEASPNMPAALQDDYIKSIDFLIKNNVSPNTLLNHGQPAIDALVMMARSMKGGIPKLAGGGYINPSTIKINSIPKFDGGINVVPEDMLAMIHKNEAVIPAQMNPFNPNNNGTIGTTIKIDSLTMQFPETPENGKQMFAEFKEAMHLDNLKKGGTITI
jgi:hypothetical protein